MSASGGDAPDRGGSDGKKGSRLAKELARGNRPIQRRARPRIPAYDPFDAEKVAPLDVEDFYSDTRADGQPLTFRFDTENPVRSVMRRNLHGMAELDFVDESTLPDAPPAYLSRVAAREHPDQDYNEQAIEDERRAAEFDQPEHVLAQFRADVANPAFLKMRQENGRVTAAPPGTVISGIAPTAPVALAPLPPLFSVSSTSATTAAAESSLAPDGNQLDADDARQLLLVDPFRALQRESRPDFLQHADVSACYRTLITLVLQHEQHREHCSIVELVSELACRGAKYGRSTKHHCAAPLGALIDRRLAGAYVVDQRPPLPPKLTGGHEHCSLQGGTTLRVLYFYLVYNNRANGELLAELVRVRDRAKAASKAAAAAKSASTSAGNIKLNKAGLFDIDSVETADPLGSTFVNGSMHDAKQLDTAFLIELRVVCVECGAHELLPPEQEQEEEDGPPALSHEHGGSVVSNQELPDERLTLTQTQSSRLVGAPRAILFQQLVNDQGVNLLCVRSFAFSVAMPTEKTRAGDQANV